VTQASAALKAIALREWLRCGGERGRLDEVFCEVPVNVRPIAPLIVRYSIPVNLFWAVAFGWALVWAVSSWGSFPANPGRMLLMIALAYFALRCLMAVVDRREQIRIDMEGVWKRGSRYGLVPWSAIQSDWLDLVCVPKFGEVLCRIHFHEPAIWLARAGVMHRLVQRVLPCRRFAIRIPLFNTDADPWAMEIAIRQIKKLSLRHVGAKPKSTRRRRKFESKKQMVANTIEQDSKQ